MLGGTGNVTVNVSDVTTEGCDGVQRAVLEFEGSNFNDRVIPLIRGNLFGVDGQLGSPRRNITGRRDPDERELY